MTDKVLYIYGLAEKKKKLGYYLGLETKRKTPVLRYYKEVISFYNLIACAKCPHGKDRAFSLHKAGVGTETLT